MTEDSRDAHTDSQLRDVNFMPPLAEAVPLGIQHVLAMFVGNVTVPLIIAGAINLPAADTIFLVQATMFVAGIATLVQALGIGPIGARLPIVMGTSFGFVPIMLPNVGLVAMTGVASRYVVAIGGGFLVIAGLLPKLGAFITTIPNAVLGGAVVIMFGLIAAAGMKMLAAIRFDKRNMLIIGISLAVAIGLRGQDGLYANVSPGLQAMLQSGLIPGAIVSVTLNLVLPRRQQNDEQGTN